MLSEFDDVGLDRCCIETEASADAHAWIAARAPRCRGCPVDGESFPLREGGIHDVAREANVEYSIHGFEAVEVVECLGEHDMVMHGAIEEDVDIILISVGTNTASDRSELGDVTLSTAGAEIGLIASVVGGCARIEGCIEEALFSCC